MNLKMMRAVERARRRPALLETVRCWVVLSVHPGLVRCAVRGVGGLVGGAAAVLSHLSVFRGQAWVV